MLPTYTGLNRAGFDARKPAMPFLMPAPPYLFLRVDSLYIARIVYFSIIPNDHRLICAWPSVPTIRDSIVVGAIDGLTENDVPPKWRHTRSVGQSVAGRAPGVVRSKWRE